MNSTNNKHDYKSGHNLALIMYNIIACILCAFGIFVIIILKSLILSQFEQFFFSWYAFCLIYIETNWEGVYGKKEFGYNWKRNGVSSIFRKIGGIRRFGQI